MTMQYDVKSAHLSQSGFLVLDRSRLKQVTYVGNASQTGTLNFFDTSVAPTSAVYARSGTTVTVTKNGHGLQTGDVVGIAFTQASGNAATNGNYSITYVDANTFTITDPNSGTVSGGTACFYVNSGNAWMTSFDTLSGAVNAQQVPVPGEGVLARNGIYATLTNINFVTIFYG